MKWMVLLLILTSPLMADDFLRDLALQDQADSLKRIAHADEMRNAVGDATPHTVNEAGQGCEWVQVTDQDGVQKWMKTETGYHRVYLKVCDYDPK